MLEAVIDGISLGFCNKKDIVCIFLSRYTDTAVHLSVARITTRTVPKVDFLHYENVVVRGHVYTLSFEEQTHAQHIFFLWSW